MVLSIVWGLVGGFVATIVMTILMAPLMMGKEANLMSYLGAKATGGDPTSQQAMMTGMGAHFAYGTIMGGIFAIGVGFVMIANPLVTGVLFGLLLFIIAAVVVMPISGAPRMPAAGVAAFFVVHLIYGAVLATLWGLLSNVPVLG